MSFGAGINNLEWLSRFGNVRIIMPWEDRVEVDLLYLAGGADLNPACYGEIPSYKTGMQDVHKQFFMEHRLPSYIEAKVPILGVCLGMQQLAVVFGSKLTQDMPFHAQSPERWQPAHVIYKIGGTKKDIVNVNSHHHQGVLKGNLGEELEPIYIALNEDKMQGGVIVEMFKHKTLPIIGIQWHPEEYFDDVANDAITNLLK